MIFLCGIISFLYDFYWVRAKVSYQKLNSNDYFYYGQQFGVTPNRVMPTGLQMQSYAVNVVGLSYNYSF